MSDEAVESIPYFDSVDKKSCCMHKFSDEKETYDAHYDCRWMLF